MLLEDDLHADAAGLSAGIGAAQSEIRRSDGVPEAIASSLFDDHVALAERLARRYTSGRGVDDDLRQVALLGLHLATQRFDPERGRFAAFASATIAGELKKHLRDMGWGLRVPRSCQEDSITVGAARERLTARLGRAPSAGEVAEHTGLEPGRVEAARRARRARYTDPLDDLERAPTLTSRASPEDAAILAVTLDQLEPTQKRLIRLRYAEGLNRTSIARRLGMSCSQVDRRLKRALTVLRRQLAESEDPSAVDAEIARATSGPAAAISDRSERSHLGSPDHLESDGEQQGATREEREVEPQLVVAFHHVVESEDVMVDDALDDVEQSPPCE